MVDRNVSARLKIPLVPFERNGYHAAQSQFRVMNLATIGCVGVLQRFCIFAATARTQTIGSGNACFMDTYRMDALYSEQASRLLVPGVRSNSGIQPA